MSALQKRQHLHQLIDLVDDRLINALHAMVNDYVQNDQAIVAYTTDGQPLTKEQFVSMVSDAHKDVIEGNFITSDELKKDMENW